ncbi:MAG: acyl carrier protein [Burkholderiaceae bacterium]|nr:acyl carrier protein [Burkholderiaceae bacterium]
MTTALKRATPEETVIAVVDDLVQDWGLDLDGGIGAATRVVADLQFASVDIIQLCVALEQTYERKFGFQDLLMKDGSYVGDLTLAQFAQFVQFRLAGA